MEKKKGCKTEKEKIEEIKEREKEREKDGAMEKMITFFYFNGPHGLDPMPFVNFTEGYIK